MGSLNSNDIESISLLISKFQAYGIQTDALQQICFILGLNLILVAEDSQTC